MDNRDTMVSKAYKNTFQWIFRQEAGTYRFSHWLGTDNSNVF